MDPTKEISTGKLSLWLEDETVCCVSQFRSITPSFLFKYRLYLAFYHFVTILLSMHVEFGFRWCFLLTTWTHCLVILYFSVGAFLSLKYIICQRRTLAKDGTKQPARDTWDGVWDVLTSLGADLSPSSSFCQLHWLNLNIATMCALSITALHWPLVQDYDKLFLDLEAFCLVDRHGLNVIFLLTDLFLCSIPINVIHVVYSWIMSAVYTSCNFAVWFFTGLKIYDLLDYENHPRFSLMFFVCGNLFLVPLGQYLLFFLQIYRDKKGKTTID